MSSQLLQSAQKKLIFYLRSLNSPVGEEAKGVEF